MMPELSLNILDVAKNSVSAGASRIGIAIRADSAADQLTITIEDNGCGMSPETVARVIDPFYTTRTTRKVGLGVPFFKMAAELTGGALRIDSTPGEGTCVTATFGLHHIDRMPLGDLASSFCALVQSNPEIDFVLDYAVDDRSFTIRTAEYREILGDVSLSEPEVLAFISANIQEGIGECGGAI